LWIRIEDLLSSGERMDYSRTSLRGKTALVTGASRNIGRAIALACAAEGADLVLNTRANRDELEAVAAECRKAGVRVVTALGDVAEPAAVEAVVQRGLAELGAIDVLVSNAAVRPHRSLEETTVEEWHQVMAVNLHATFYLARAVVPGMKQRRRGSIIALGGQSSVTSRPNTAAVTTTKHGLLGLIRALAAELGPFGIRANMVLPGYIDTERRYAEWYPEFRQAPPGSAEQLERIPLRRLGVPDDIANACVFLASEASAYVTGDALRVMGGRVIG
jgi:NAD(P)-dependent dehydrogenase (short-subunit alcohol dehydrogenase family)